MPRLSRFLLGVCTKDSDKKTSKTMLRTLQLKDCTHFKVLDYKFRVTLPELDVPRLSRTSNMEAQQLAAIYVCAANQRGNGIAGVTELKKL